MEPAELAAAGRASVLLPCLSAVHSAEPACPAGLPQCCLAQMRRFSPSRLIPRG